MVWADNVRYRLQRKIRTETNAGKNNCFMCLDSYHQGFHSIDIDLRAWFAIFLNNSPTAKMINLNALLFSRIYICKAHFVQQRKPNLPYESGFIGPTIINSNVERNNMSNTVPVLIFHDRKDIRPTIWEK